MITRFTALLLLCAIVGGAVAADAQPLVREERPNAVGGELLGRGLILTLNYERWLNNSFGLGAGLMAISADGDGVIILPLYAQTVIGNKHGLYLSAGITSFNGGSDINDYETNNAGTLAIGYQYQSEAGFFVRPLFTYLSLSDVNSNDTGLIWPGITIGGSF